jgi:hypothetical protein
MKFQYFIVPYGKHTLFGIANYQYVAFIRNSEDIGLFRFEQDNFSLLLCLDRPLRPCNHLPLWTQSKKKSIFVIILQMSDFTFMCNLLPSDVAIWVIMEHLSSAVANHKTISNLNRRRYLLFIPTQDKYPFYFALFEIDFSCIFPSNNPNRFFFFIVKLVYCHNFLIFGHLEMIQLHNIDSTIRIKQFISNQFDST